MGRKIYKLIREQSSDEIIEYVKKKLEKKFGSDFVKEIIIRDEHPGTPDLIVKTTKCVESDELLRIVLKLEEYFIRTGEPVSVSIRIQNDKIYNTQ